MPAARSARKSKSSQLLAVLDDHEQLLIVTHDNPDPDAIATGWAVHRLIDAKLHKPVRLVGGGGIVRAENRQMVDLLEPPIELVPSLDATEGTGAILVDCAFGKTNQLLTRERIRPVAVIDHHEDRAPRVPIPFRDVRVKVAASASIAASYLREQNVEPGGKLATAMMYALRTETIGREFRYSALDRSILVWLTKRVDPALLAEIENAPLEVEYYADLVLALQNAFIYDGTALCLLPRAEGPEIVGEVADLLIRCKGIRRVLCGAVVGDDLYLSARTGRSLDNAAELLQATLEGLGGGGGHPQRAGGKIGGIGAGLGSAAAEKVQKLIRSRWLAACGVDRKQGRRLVAKREIVKNL